MRQMPLWLGGYCFVLLIVPHPLWNNLYAVLGGFGLLVLCIRQRRAAVRHVPARIHWRWTDAHCAPLLLYTLWVTLLFLGSANAAQSLRFYLFYLTGAVIAFLLLYSIRNWQSLTLFLRFLGAALGLAAGWACLQWVTGAPARSGQTDPATTGGALGRAESFYGNANTCAHVILLLFPWVLYLYMQGATKRERALWGSILFLAGLGMLFTLSRSGWIALILEVFVFALIMDRRALGRLCAVSIGLLPLLPEPVFLRLGSIFSAHDSSLQARDAIFEVMRPVVRDFALAGTGLGSDVTQRVSGVYDMAGWGNIPHMHNTYLQILLETGLAGLILWLGLTLGLSVQMLTHLRHPKTPLRARAVLAAGLSGLCGILIASTQEHILFYPRVYILFYITLGISMTALRLIRINQKEVFS
jgi:O-antigen ligase